jgi:hypothetical protein
MWLLEPRSGAAAVLVDEIDAGHFLGTSKREIVSSRH